MADAASTVVAEDGLLRPTPAPTPTPDPSPEMGMGGAVADRKGRDSGVLSLKNALEH